MRLLPLLLVAALAADAQAHGSLPVARQILFRGDTILLPTISWGLFVGTADGPFRWICDEAINDNLDRLWGLSLDGTLHATDARAGLVTSRDDGCDWTAATGDVAARHVSFIVGDPVAPARAWVTTDSDKVANALYVTDDSGASFRATLTADEAFSGVALSGDGAVIWVAGMPPTVTGAPPPTPQLHVSTDHGATFVASALGWTDAAHGGAPPSELVALAVDPSDPSTVWLAALSGEDRVLLQVHGGVATERLRVGGDIGGVAFDAKRGQVYAATWKGLYRAPWPGVSDAPLARASSLVETPCIAVHDGDLWVCGWNYAPDNLALGRSSDGGDHFTTVFRYGQTLGPVESCAAGSPVASICPGIWASYSCQLGVGCGESFSTLGSDGGLAPATRGSGCDLAGDHAARGGHVVGLEGLLIALAPTSRAWRHVRRRRRRGVLT